MILQLILSISDVLQIGISVMNVCVFVATLCVR